MPCPERCRRWAGSQKSCAPWALGAQGPGCPWALGTSGKREGSHWHSPRWALEGCLVGRGAHWCLRRGLGKHPPWFWRPKGHWSQSMASLCLLSPVSWSPAVGWSCQIYCTLLSAWPGGWSHSELPPVGKQKRCLGGEKEMCRRTAHMETWRTEEQRGEEEVKRKVRERGGQ